MSSALPLEVETTGESSGFCDCCGRTSQTVWGLVSSHGTPVASYFVQWTVDHLSENGANIDLIIGSWGEGTEREDRAAVSLRYRLDEDGIGSVMVIDAHDRPTAKSELVGSVLRRDEVIGSPLATQVFDLVDAIFLQDDRFF